MNQARPQEFRSRNSSNASSEIWQFPYNSTSISPVSNSSAHPPYYLSTANNPFEPLGTPEAEDSLYPLPDLIALGPDGYMQHLTPRGHSPLTGVPGAPAPIPLDERLFLDVDVVTQDYYMEQYWLQFHPVFPIIHKPTFHANTAGSLLLGAMLAIGAQYVDNDVASKHAQNLFTACQKQLAVSVPPFTRDYINQSAPLTSVPGNPILTVVSSCGSNAGDFPNGGIFAIQGSSSPAGAFR